MYEIGTATSNHDAIGVWIGFCGRDGLREPADREAGVDDTDLLSVVVLNGLAKARHHLARVRSHVIVHVWLRPARLVEQHGHEVPVHEEILVLVAAALYGSDAVAVMLGVGREVPALVLEIVRLEGDGTVVEVGVIQ